MKTTTLNQISNGETPLADWLSQGETVVVTNEAGRCLGRFLPNDRDDIPKPVATRELFAKRFAPLASVPQRDLRSHG